MRMSQLRMSLGPRSQAVQYWLRYSFPKTKGPWTNAPKNRVGSFTGPGATYRFKSQADGAQAFMNFADPTVNRNTTYTQQPIYDRLGSPLTEDAETRVVGLVGGNFNDIEAIAMTNGQSANSLAMRLFTAAGACRELEARRRIEVATIDKQQLNRGRNGMIAPKGGLYGCTFDEIRHLAESEGRDVFLLDLSDLNKVRETLISNPHIKLIFCEPLNNPTLTLVDIQALAKIRNDINERNGYEGRDKVRLVVDTTFTTTQIRPFEWKKELQPDAVTISGTKLMAGGSHMAGFFIAPREHIAGVGNALFLRKNTVPSIMHDVVAKDLIENGLPTILQRALLTQHNAFQFAMAFAGDDRLRIYYPGLESFPQYALAQRLMVDMDGNFAPSHMLRVHLNAPSGLEEKIAARLINHIANPSRLKYRLLSPLTYAVSLGNDRGLVSQSSTTTQAVMELIQSDILPDKLLCGPADIRMSIGWLRSADDSIGQFSDALNFAFEDMRH